MVFPFTGAYTRFDGIVFPEEPPSTFTKMISETAKKYLPGIFGSSSEVKQPSFTAAQEECLHVFLSDHGQLLKSLDSPSSSKVSNLEKSVNEIYKIYEQLRVRQTLRDTKADWVATSLAKVRKSYIHYYYFQCRNYFPYMHTQQGVKQSVMVSI